LGLGSRQKSIAEIIQVWSYGVMYNRFGLVSLIICSGCEFFFFGSEVYILELIFLSGSCSIFRCFSILYFDTVCFAE
jgi:hypothetical protein